MRIFRSPLAACLVLTVATAAAGYSQTQPAPKPFTKDDVVKLLFGSVPIKRVEVLVRERGIDFQITPETESELREAGATDPLLATLRELAPKPPTLVLTTNPGRAQVFLDDELIARTSAEGRLKIPNLTAGPHKLRVSLDGYRDHEENVELVAGETLAVSMHFERDAQPSLPAATDSSSSGSDASNPSAAAHASQGTTSNPYPGAYRVGGGVSAPKAIHAPSPKYSKQARQAKYQGTVVLWLVVDSTGLPQEIRVQRSLGMGLDEEAVEAVKKWRFQPAMKDGQPVPVMINVEVNFRLD